MRRLWRLVMLGRMAEQALRSNEEVYLVNWSSRGGKGLRVDGCWALTAEQTRLVRSILDE